MLQTKVESLAIGLEIGEGVPRCCHYRKVVYNPRRDQQSDDLLEEALATAESCLRLEEPACRRAIPADVMERTCAWLVPWGSGAASRLPHGGRVPVRHGLFDDILGGPPGHGEDPRLPPPPATPAPHDYL